MSSSERHLETTPEILAYIHDRYLKEHASRSPNESVQWDCVLELGIHHDEQDKTQNE